MYSFTSRLNTVLTYALTVLGFIVLVLSISSNFIYYNPQNINANIRVTRVEKFNPLEASQFDKARLYFDLEADLRKLFNWNVKELFVFLVAEYETKKGQQTVFNQITLWDKIIWHNETEKANLNFKNLRSKYLFVDKGKNLRSKKVKLVLKWNIVPFSGQLFVQEAPSDNHFVMPSKYMKNSRNDMQEEYENVYHNLKSGMYDEEDDMDDDDINA